MDVPPESGLDVRPFLAVTAWLRAGRFSAPEVLGADRRRGLVLLEDLGDDLFAAALRADARRARPGSTAPRSTCSPTCSAGRRPATTSAGPRRPTTWPC